MLLCVTVLLCYCISVLVYLSEFKECMYGVLGCYSVLSVTVYLSEFEECFGFKVRCSGVLVIKGMVLVMVGMRCQLC